MWPSNAFAIGESMLIQLFSGSISSAPTNRWRTSSSAASQSVTSGETTGPGLGKVKPAKFANGARLVLVNWVTPSTGANLENGSGTVWKACAFSAHFGSMSAVETTTSEFHCPPAGREWDEADIVRRVSGGAIHRAGRCTTRRTTVSTEERSYQMEQGAASRPPVGSRTGAVIH